MSKNFLDRIGFRTKKIHSSTIFKNLNKSVNKDTSGMITKKIFSLNIIREASRIDH